MRAIAILGAAALLLACQHTVVPTPGASPSQSGPQPHGATQEATVVSIVDGDTIHVDIDGVEYRVRYIGIDAPEIAHDTNPGERLGPQATQANADLVEGERVILEKDTSDTDQFGRLLRYVWLPTDGPFLQWTMVDLELAAEGMADVKRYPPDTYWQSLLQEAEDRAKASDLGIWAN
ncbi:MAG: thermonuclease family protein [Candidatus Limnocylindrales bacterium]